MEFMEPPVLSETELAELAHQVDEQLKALRSRFTRESASRSINELLDAPAQRAVIERAAGEPFESFWQKYCRHARRDLCTSGGLLYEQWRKWQNLQSKDSVKLAYGIAAGMGISTASLGPVAVAASVFLINVLTKIGIEAICEGTVEKTDS
jgi:hypothetical protein